MTTVAYRDGVMAADTAATWDMGGNYRTRSVKIYRSRGCLIGICGDYYAAQMFVDWFEENEEGENRPASSEAGDFLAMVAYPNGRLYTVNCFYTLVEEDSNFFAIGSGAAYALSAMELGLSAPAAVEHAAKFDIYTGGEITVERLPR